MKYCFIQYSHKGHCFRDDDDDDGAC